MKPASLNLKDQILTPWDAQLLLQRIFTPGFIPHQSLYDVYVRYLIAREDGNEKVTYPVSANELRRTINDVLETGR